ncbi:MAG: hypothetical protein EB162_04225, partial [Euryarchaeota archaeon]|nr:hypothetical protein [Euryarchaeota archaeon]
AVNQAELEAAQAQGEIPLGTPQAPGLEGLEGAGIGYVDDVPITETDVLPQAVDNPELARATVEQASAQAQPVDTVEQASAQAQPVARQITPTEADVVTRTNFTPVEPTFDMGEDINEQAVAVDLKPAGGSGLRVKIRVDRPIDTPMQQEILSVLSDYKNLPDDYPVYIIDEHPESSNIEGMANYSGVTGKSQGVFLFLDTLERHASQGRLKVEDVIAEEIGVHAMQRLAPDTTRSRSEAFWSKVYKENQNEIRKFWAENGSMGEVYGNMDRYMQAEEWMAKISREEMAEVTAGKRRTFSQAVQSYIRYVKATLQSLTGKQYTKEQVQRVIIKMAEGQRVRTVDQMSLEEKGKWTGNKGFNKGGAVDKAVKERESMTSNERLREYLPDEDVEQASINHGANAKPGWPTERNMWKYMDRWDGRSLKKIKGFKWSGKSAELISDKPEYEAEFNKRMSENIHAAMSHIQSHLNKHPLKLEAKFERPDKWTKAGKFQRGSIYVKVRRKDDPSIHFQFRISDHVEDLGEIHRQDGPVSISMSNSQFKKFSDADKAKIDKGFELLLDKDLYKMAALQAAIDYPINDGFVVKPLSSTELLRNGNPANAKGAELSNLTKGRGNLRFVRPDGTTPLDLRAMRENSGEARNTFPLGTFTYKDFVSGKFISKDMLKGIYFGDVDRGQRLAGMLEDSDVGMFSYGGIDWKAEGPSEFEVGKYSNMPKLSVSEFTRIVNRVNLEPKHKRVWDVLDRYVADGDADDFVAKLQELGDAYARYREDMIKELEDGGFIKDGKVTALRIENYFGTGWIKGQPAASFSLLKDWGMVRSNEDEASPNGPGKSPEGGMADPEKRWGKEPQSLLVREIPVDSILGLGYGFEGEIIADTATVSMLSAQKYSSSETSIKQAAALLKREGLFKSGDRNLDLGGGKFDLGVKQLKEYGVESRVHDKFNRDEAHNKKVEAWYENDPVDTVTIANVLNVIKEKEARAEVLQQAYDALRDGGKVYISVYHDSKKEAGETSKGWQNHMPIREYLPEVRKVFPNARVERGIIVASKSWADGEVSQVTLTVAEREFWEEVFSSKTDREELLDLAPSAELISNLDDPLTEGTAILRFDPKDASGITDYVNDVVAGREYEDANGRKLLPPSFYRENGWSKKVRDASPDVSMASIGGMNWKGKKKEERKGLTRQQKRTEQESRKQMAKAVKPLFKFDEDGTLKMLSFGEPDSPADTNEEYQKKYGTPKTWSDVNWINVLTGKGEAIPQSVKDWVNNWFTNLNGKFIEKYGVDMTSASISGLGGLKSLNLYLKKRYEMMGKYLKVDTLAKEIYDTFNAAKPEEQSMVFDYLVGDILYDQLIHYVSPEVAALARKTRLQIDQNGQALVRMGVLKPETYFDNVNYESKFEKAQGYLPRMYLKHVLDRESYGILAGGGSISGQGYLKKRQDLDQATRDLLGEIVNPGFLGANTISQVGRDIATAEFLDFISHFGNEDWILPDSMVKVSLVIENGVAKMVRNEKSGKKVSAHWLRAEAAEMAAREAYFDLNTERGKSALKNSQSVRRDMEKLAAENEAMLEGMGISVQTGKKNSMRGDKVVIKVPKGYTEKTWKQKRSQFRKVPDSKKYGVLAGMYVNKRIYNDLFGAKGTSKMEQHAAWRAASTMHSWFKIAKVPLNPPTIFRNFLSNIVLMSLDGMSMLEISDSLTRAVRIIRSQKGRAWEAAQKYGVPLQTFTSQEMSIINKEFRNLAANNPKWKDNFFAIGKAITKATDVYGKIETVMKIAVIEHYMSKGATEWEAVQRAQETLFDYSLLNRSARLFRQVPIGAPFLSFSLLSLKRMGQIAARNPMRFAKWYFFTKLIWMGASALEGVDDDDLEEMHKMLPKYLEDKEPWMMVPLWFRDSKGKMQFTDLAYIYPFAMHFEIVRQALKGEVDEAMKDFGLGGAPLMQIASGMVLTQRSL